MRKTISGFTIVELLIVIVVIAILAAITIVGYNGIQQRARLSTAQSELANLAKTVELFMVDEGTPPDTAAEWGQILRKANLFDATRSNTEKAFMFCWDANKYAIVASTPLTLSPTFWYVKDGAVRSANWDSSVPGTFAIERTCAQPPVLPGNTGRTWSHQAS